MRKLNVPWVPYLFTSDQNALDSRPYQRYSNEESLIGASFLNAVKIWISFSRDGGSVKTVGYGGGSETANMMTVVFRDCAL